MKPFIFVYSGGAAEREELVKALDKIPEIFSWRYDTTACFYILSNSTAKTLAEAIKKHHPKLDRHIITELGDDYWGELTSESWYMLQNKEVAPRSNTQIHQ